MSLPPLAVTAPWENPGGAVALSRRATSSWPQDAARNAKEISAMRERIRAVAKGDGIL